MRIIGGWLTWTENVPINNNWPLVIFLLLTALVIFWCWRRGRRHKRWYFWPLPLILPCLLLIGGALLNTHFGLYVRLGDLFDQYPFPTTSARALSATSGNYPQGVTAVTTIPGSQSGVGPHTAFVWLPPQYFKEPTSRFPVVYLVPGTPGTPSDWSTGGNVPQTGLANARAGRPAVIVSVSAGSNQLEDTECVNGSQGNWQTYLSEDVPNYINGNARVLQGPKNQAFAGLSMGGFCAQITTLRNPSRFGIFGNFSGTTLPTYNDGLPALFGDQPNLTQTINSYRSDWIIANQPQSRTVVGQVITGAQDSAGLLADEKQFVAKAQSLGMNVTMSTPPGEHTFYLWASALQTWLPWALEQMGKPTPVK